MNKKALLISSSSFEGVESFDWFQDLPNIADYDIIILDTPRIFTFWSLGEGLEHLGGNEYSLRTMGEMAKKIKSNLLLVKRKLAEVLRFRVDVYALYNPDTIIGTKASRQLFPDIAHATPRTTHSEEFPRSKWILNPQDKFNTNEWNPISINTVEEKGKKILVKDTNYEEYFRDFKSWQYYFDPDSISVGQLEGAYSSKWKVTYRLNIIATNKVNKPLAIEFVTFIHHWMNAKHSAWADLPFEHGGNLVLLPVVDIYNTQPLIEVLLRQIKGLEKIPPPDWVKGIEIPREAPLKSEIAAEKRGLETIESRLKGLEGSLSELQRYKGLLYETGLPLQGLVKSTLERLGASTKPSIVTDEFIIDIGGKEALIEVKGVTKSISKADVAQLSIDRAEHLKATGEDIKGILIGNAWRLLPLEQRDTHDKPIFPSNVERIAGNHNIGLISTTELYKVFCKTLEEPQYKKEVLDKVINGKGVITFQ